MKKIVSILLALVMVVATCTALVTTTSAATNTDFPKTWDFDNASGTGTDLLNSIGWTVLDNSANLSASVEDGALRLQNAGNSRIHMLVCENEQLKDRFTIRYDFKYAAKTGNYNSIADQAGFFIGNNGTAATNTWQVQPRINGNFMNGVQGVSTWVEKDMGSYSSSSKVIDTWFTVKIEYSPDNNVTASIQKKGAATWSHVEDLSPTEQSAAGQATGYNTKYLRFALSNYVDIYVDNISISDEFQGQESWDFENVSGSGTALLSSIGWKPQSDTSKLTATVEGGALRLQNNAASTFYMLVCEGEALKGAYTIQYDFKYAAKTGSYNSVTDVAGFFSGDDGASVAGTWHVQPRLYGQLLNAPKTDGNDWVNASRMSGNRFGTLSGGVVTEQWFTVKIDYYGSAIKASIMSRGSSTPLVTDVYSEDQIAASVVANGFVSKYLRFNLGNYVDIYLDNISITTKDYLPELYGVQFKDSASSFDMRMVSTIKDLNATKVGYYVAVSYFDESLGKIRTAIQKKECDYVYKSITFQDGNGTATKTADQLCAGMGYIYALHLEGIPICETYTYYMIPYEERDGETLYGRMKILDRSMAKENLPKYDTTSGTVNDFLEFCAGGYYTRQIVGTNASEFNAYVTKLGNAGYTLYQSRDNVNGNYFRTFYNDHMMVHLYYMPAANTCDDFTQDVVRIVVSDDSLADAFPKEAYGDAAVTQGSAIFMGLNYTKHYHGSGGDNGLGVVFQNPDGSYVIVDGAWDADTETLYQYLKANNKRADGKIVIRAWIVTHPHEDHWGNIVEFAARYAGETKRCEKAGCIANDGYHDYSDVTVEYFVGQLNHQYCVGKDKQTYDGSEKIRAAAAKFGAKTIVPQTGQVMYFGELQVEFLYTLETLLNPNSVQKYLSGVDGNEQSLIFRGTFRNGTESVLITGDASQNESRHADIMYYQHLKSDYVTLPHHGIDATTDRFYEESVQPKYVLVATSAAATTSRINSSRSSNRVGGIHKAVDYAESVGGAYYSAEGEYRKFAIGPQVYSKLNLYQNDTTHKDTITLEDFFK